MKERKSKHFVGKSFKSCANRCLNCGQLIDAATGIDHRNKPKPGAITVCWYCGHLMAFDKKLRLRELTGQEMIDIAGNEAILLIQKARQLRDQRQCPICHAADQHASDCMLMGREHAYIDPETVDWPRTLQMHGISLSKK